MHKIFGILFSRFVVNVFLIALQIALIVAFMYFLDRMFMVFYILTMLVGTIICIYLLIDHRTPEIKIPWLLLLIIVPILGILLYLLNGNRKARAQYSNDSVKAAFYNLKDAYLIRKFESDDRGVSGQAKYIVNNANYHIYGDTNATYHASGEEMYGDMLTELEKAEKFIFLQFFIIDSGHMWDSILEILIRKVKAGVDVRIIYDDIGSIWTLPNNYYRDLRKMGIKCEVFNRLKPIISMIYNIRDHRKIIVIDGNVGFTGGINIADEYINLKERFGHWKDAGIKLEGSAVQNLTSIFLNTWHMITGVYDELEKFLPTVEISNGDGYFAPYDDNPLDAETVGETVYLNMINTAVDYVYITTPYLILTYEFVVALTNAAKRGVDVKIITPAIPDKWVVHAITQTYYEVLRRSGVKIYEYEAGFIHSKIMVCDDRLGIVGTINLDFRSLYHHYENAVWIYNSSILLEMKADFENTREKSVLMTKEKYKETPLFKRFVGAVAKIFAPLM